VSKTIKRWDQSKTVVELVQNREIGYANIAPFVPVGMCYNLVFKTLNLIILFSFLHLLNPFSNPFFFFFPGWFKVF